MDTNKLSEALLSQLDEKGQMSDDALKAVNDYTRHKMYRLEHIPTKYYLPPAHGGPQGDELKRLYAEINEKGYIDLDEDGEPCVLSGKAAVL